MQKKYAIYSRKSKFTGKGESIANQIEMCRKKLDATRSGLRDEDVLIFEDEGFSGKNTKRPAFQRMMQQCREGKIECIICYRLDRISRNTIDFLTMYEELDSMGVSFISVHDNFDTSTAIGKAMLVITSAFAELERNIIAERIQDNMHELAKTGRWLGGNPPTGYRSVGTVGSFTEDGKTRKAKKLEVIPEQAALVKMIFRKFLELRSLTALDAYLLQNDIQSKNGKAFTRCTLKSLLQNPVYMIADEDAWHYYQLTEAQVYAEETDFDGLHGIMAYNKTDEHIDNHNVCRPIDKWIIAVGAHEGLISGKDWTAVQKIFEQNRAKSYRKPRSNTALLSGRLYCAECGSFMRPKLSQRLNKDGEVIYDYLCELKEKSKKHKCSMKRINGNALDRMVCEEIRRLSEQGSDLMKLLKGASKEFTVSDQDYLDQIQRLRQSVRENETRIKNLTAALSSAADTAAYPVIISEISELTAKGEALQEQIREYESLAQTTALSAQEIEQLGEMMLTFVRSFDDLTVQQRRDMLRALIHRVTWDGETVHILFFGSDQEEILDYSSMEKGAAATGLQMKSSCTSAPARST